MNSIFFLVTSCSFELIILLHVYILSNNCFSIYARFREKHETNHEINAVPISGNANAMRAHDSGNSTHLFYTFILYHQTKQV